MKRNLLYVMLFVALGGLLGACSGGDKEVDADPPAVDPPTPPVTELGVPKPVLKSRTTGQLTFGWAAVEGATAYRCELRPDDLTEWLVSERTDKTEITISNLTPGKTYRFRVQALNNSLQSAFSAELTAATEAEQTPEPQQLTLKFPNSEATDGIVRAFPGAEGAGMYTTGGRGGKVIHVTNLNDSGAGSLRAAIEEKGPRTVVFDVGGVIELKSNLSIKNGDLTIAGQTAPGDGICLRYRSLVVNADNVIIRYLRSRPGVTGDPDQDADGLDAIWGRNCSHVILDHCSMSWSTDECSSFYANSHFTMQWCLLTESLHNAGHTKGSHGYGGIWGGAPASFHHNLVADHDSRNPRFDSPNTYRENDAKYRFSLADRRIDFRNNVVYNFCNFPAYGGEGQRYNFVGNTYKWGPASVNGSGSSYKDGKESVNKGHRRAYFYQVDGTYTTGGKTYDEGAAEIYLGGNTNCFDTSVLPGSGVGANLTADNRSGFVLNEKTLSAKRPDITWLSAPLAIADEGRPCDVTTHAAGTGFERVLACAGASLRRDAVDERAARQTRQGTFDGEGSLGSRNGIIDLPSDVGGYPTYPAGETPKDSDRDGMPDSFEQLAGLNPNEASDANGHAFDPRYTNLEIYLHWLVQEITLQQVAGGTSAPLN